MRVVWRRLTCMEVPDGGGGYPVSWRKGWADYLDMLFWIPLLGVWFVSRVFLDD